MSKLQELIDKLCPDGVIHTNLGNHIKLSTGEQLNKSDMCAEGSYPVINGGTTASGYVEKYNEQPNTITISQGGASAGYVAWQTCKFWAGAHCYVVKPNEQFLLNKFVCYFLKGKETMLQQMQHGAGIPALNREKINKLDIPVPPIEVQEEIVRILDNFSEYAAELQAELQGRKEQYEYYRNLLLTFNPSACGCRTDGEQNIEEVNNPILGNQEVEWKPMGEIVEKINNIKWKENTLNSFLYIDLSSVDCQTHRISENLESITYNTAPSRAQQIVKANDVLFGTTRPTLMRFAFVPQKYDGQICSTGYSVLRANKSIIFPRYLYFILNTTRFFVFVDNNQEGAGYPAISNTRLMKYMIPIPPLEVQEKIVSILDRFETLVNDLSEGLPAEIAAVKEQYEYYRDKLLTFKPLDKEDE